MPCPAIDDAAFLTSFVAHLDCQAQTLGEGGFIALSAGGSPVMLALRAALTPLIAVLGFRLLFRGHLPTYDTVSTVLLIGITVMLATSWPAFRTLAYDLALKAPAQLAERVGSAADLGVGGGQLIDRLQGSDYLLTELSNRGAGAPPPLDAEAADQGQILRSNMVRDSERLESARSAYLTTTIAALGGPRLVGGLLLALGPLFAIFFLFDASRGLFLGWVRALLSVSLIAFAATLILAVQQAFMEPWLIEVVTSRRAGYATPAAPAQLAAITSVFGLLLGGAAVASWWVAGGLRDRALARLGDESRIERDVVRQTERQVSIAREREMSQISRAQRIAEATRLEARRAAVQPDSPLAASVGAAGPAAGRGSFVMHSSRASERLRTTRGEPYGARSATRISPASRKRDDVG